jgi:hypothetical protein
MAAYEDNPFDANTTGLRSYNSLLIASLLFIKSLSLYSYNHIIFASTIVTIELRSKFRMFPSSTNIPRILSAVSVSNVFNTATLK